VQISIIGDGELAPELHKEAQGLANVGFTGWLAAEEVRRRIRSATALCAPSVVAQDGDADGLPSVVLEAMADGVPVIGTNQAGIAEAVEHGITGLLVPSGAAAALAEAIRTIVLQQGLRHTLGEAARRVARERFNAVVQSRLLEDTLLEVKRRAQANAQLQSARR
jgi:glycosyltransferase involved in cell wall biosynthesis